MQTVKFQLCRQKNFSNPDNYLFRVFAPFIKLHYPSVCYVLCRRFTNRLSLEFQLFPTYFDISMRPVGRCKTKLSCVLNLVTKI
ncbi:hypothetical protein J2X69_000978 [Algoriphagus sp. 4150]|nr:hypothetical protein [Algoriphagus sp. 4150]